MRNPLTRYCHTTVTFGLIVAISNIAFAGQEDRPETAFEDAESYRVESVHGIVAADQQLASEAGAYILEAGGNAADAGVTALLTLGVVHPFSSGLGGGGFCLYREAEKQKTTVLDFREMAPAAAHRDLYIVDGEHRPDLARHGGLAVGVPGEAAGLWALHGRFGTLEWEEVVDPALRLAEQGFPVGSTLSRHLGMLTEMLADWPELAAVFQDADGEFLTEGDLMTRDDLVRTYMILRDQGVRPFYVGKVADAMAASAQQYGGILTAEDLANYRVIPRDPITSTIGDYEIHAMPPPSSGGIALIQALNILSFFDSDELDDDQRLHLQIEALKHAFADRAHWLGDSDFVDVPVEKLTSPEYARELAEKIDLDGVLEPEEYGTTAPDVELEGTAHLSIVDAEGNMLSCTSTINTRFGSLVYVPEYGIVLNNEMADFNTQPGEANLYGLIGNEQNAVEAGKRPLSSMSPTLVMENGESIMTLGASGGPTIISGVYFTLLNALFEGKNLLDTVTAPRVHHQWMPYTVFTEDEELPFVGPLRDRGHEFTTRPSFTAVQVILRRNDRWIGISDPRKGGIPASPQSPSGQ